MSVVKRNAANDHMGHRFLLLFLSSLVRVRAAAAASLCCLSHWST